MKNMDVATYTELLMINVLVVSPEHAVGTAEHLANICNAHFITFSERERDEIAVAICLRTLARAYDHGKTTQNKICTTAAKLNITPHKHVMLWRVHLKCHNNELKRKQQHKYTPNKVCDCAYVFLLLSSIENFRKYVRLAHRVWMQVIFVNDPRNHWQIWS